MAQETNAEFDFTVRQVMLMGRTPHKGPLVGDTAADLGLTTLAALHDLNLAAEYCDRVYVMQAGRFVASGPPHNVLTSELIEAVFGVRADRIVHPTTGRLHLAFSPMTPAETKQ